MSEVTEVVCTHHWRIEAPNGTPTLRGRCALCGESRLFPASPETKYEAARNPHPFNNPVTPRAPYDTTEYRAGMR